MSKDMFDKIFRRKEEKDEFKKNDKPIEIEVDGLGIFKFKKITASEFKDIVDSDSENKDAELLYYQCIEPNVKDKDFLQRMGATSEPDMVFEKFLQPSEMSKISEIILKESKIIMNTVQLVKEVKN